MMKSPYKDVPVEKWLQTTQRLVSRHPLSASEIVDVVLGAWDSIFVSSMGSHGFRIGVDIFPKPQIMGFFLHELIPLEFATRYPKGWRKEVSKEDKDIVCTTDGRYSIELKTSSSVRGIFGNRSYAQSGSRAIKGKSGYYLAVNFQKFVEKRNRPEVTLIRFGWIDAADWIGQKAPTGQQSRIPPDVEKFKLIELYSISAE
jgi:hypothetical protein